MNTWSNYHTHSNFCDGKGTLDDYVKKAEALQLASIGFSSHAPLPFDCKWCMKADQLSTYLQAVDTLKRSSTTTDIYAGLEVDFIPNIISPKQFIEQLDYTIGSIHFVDQLPDGTRWEIDGQHSHFLEGLEKIYEGNIREAIIRYFELTVEMINTSRPTILGHFDKIKIQNLNGKFFDEKHSWYQDEAKKVLDVAADCKTIIEVNTRGLYQKKSSTPYPSPWILKEICQRNIPVVISSDAHHPDDIVNQFEDTASLIFKAGIRHLHMLHDGQWKPYRFNELGVLT